MTWWSRFPGGERAADLLLWLAVGVPVFFTDDSIDQWQHAGLPFDTVRIAAVPLLGLAVVVGRRHPVVAAAVPVGLGLAATPELYTANFMIAQVLLAFLLGRRTSDMRIGLLFFAGVGVTGLVLVRVVHGLALSNWLTMLYTAVAMILLPWLGGRYVRQHDELVRTGWELAERLEREQKLVGERTRLLERSRIAGDMHDSLGHELSLVALHAAALQVSPGLDDSARAAARRLRESAARATEGLREIIGVLREDGGAAPVVPSGDTVAALVARAAVAGMAVTLDGELPPLPPMAERAAYRVVQEALTNAAKHAPGAAVTVRLGVESDAAVITVLNAAAPAGPLPGAGTGGYGLVGLDERVRLAGGRLYAGSVGGGRSRAAGGWGATPGDSVRPVAGGVGTQGRGDGAVRLVGGGAGTRVRGGGPVGPMGDGFQVMARLPLTAGAAATPPDAKGELALARGRVRRSVIDAIWVPVAAATVLILLTSGYDLYTAHHSVLAPEVYGELRVGQSLPSMEGRLPPYRANGDDLRVSAPADPPDTDECRFYRTGARSLATAYRLCFTDGRLSHKDKLPIARP